jgi:DNA-binding HxlR family transcriptional regulator
MATDQRSGCPINLATEVLGDRWSMVVLRDVMFGDRRTFRDVLNNSLEGIATNILGSRLKKLVDDGLLTSAADPNHKQRTFYSLTEKSIALLPALIALGAWARRFLPTTPELAIRNQVLEEGGAGLQEAFMAELRERHLGIPNPNESPPVSHRLEAAYAATIAQASNRTPERSPHNA